MRKGVMRDGPGNTSRPTLEFYTGRTELGQADMAWNKGKGRKGASDKFSPTEDQQCGEIRQIPAERRIAQTDATTVSHHT